MGTRNWEMGHLEGPKKGPLNGPLNVVPKKYELKVNFEKINLLLHISHIYLARIDQFMFAGIMQYNFKSFE